jgi:hypothetical protein
VPDRPAGRGGADPRGASCRFFACTQASGSLGDVVDLFGWRMSMNALKDRVLWLNRALAIVLATAMLAACGGGSEESDAAIADANVSKEAQPLQAPDDESLVVELPNGGAVAGNIRVGRTKKYTFTANVGEGIQLRLVDKNGGTFYPRLDITGPGGSVVGAAWGADVAVSTFAAPATGTYTVVAADYYGTNSGRFELHYARAPGANEGGLLTSGGVAAGSLTKGDIDSYTFTANVGDGIQLRLVDVNATTFFTRIWVYGPTGALVTNAYDADVALLSFAAPADGTYTVVVTDYYGPGTGNYEVHYTRAPGANEEGALVNGGLRNGVMTKGDLDSYTFTANVGEGIQIRLADIDATGFYPRIWLYGPTGALVTNAYDPDVAVLSVAAPASGTYTVVVADYYGTGTGDYELHFVRGTGANEHGALINGGVRNETLTLGDLDSYTFVGSAGQSVQLRMTDTTGGAMYPRIWLYGPTGALVTNAYGPDVATINVTLSASGTFTVLASDYYGTGTGTYTLGLNAP